MKIVQSLWSKPGQKREGQHPSNLGACGWADKKYNYLSWALSCLQFKKYYDEVELVTDKAGYELLVKKLELPYTKTHIVLDSLNDYHPDLWAIGKIYAYSIQEEPFIHADGDVIVWDKFNEKFENSSLLCQCKEEGHPFDKTYSNIFGPIVSAFEFYPEILTKSIERNGSLMAVNAGIIGGHNIDFFKDYTRRAFEFVDKNTSRLSEINVETFNLIFEQFLFRALSEERGEEISYFNPDTHLSDDFTGIPSTTKYIHRPGKWKREKYFTSCLEYRMLTDYPDRYFKIINLLRTFQI